MLERHAVCEGCGAAGPLSVAEERGRIAFLLDVIERAVRVGLLTPLGAERVVAPYRQKAGFPPPPPRATLGAARREPAGAPRPPVNPTVMWANGLLYLGAFFVVLTGLLFLLVLGGLGRTALAAGVALGFMAGGIVCRRFEIVRTAGSVFLGTGAVLVPLVFASVGVVLADRGPLGPRIIWLVASASCFLLYSLMTFLGLGRFYSVLTLVAASNAFLALHAAARLDARWLATVFAFQALTFVVVHFAGGELLSRRFGWLVFAWGLAWTFPALIGWMAVSSLTDRLAPLPPLALLILLAWLVQWRRPNALAPVAACLMQLALAAQVLLWVGAPGWSVGVLWPLVGALYVAGGQVRNGSLLGRELLIVGLAAAALGGFPALDAPSDLVPFLAMSIASGAILGAGLALRSGLVLAAWAWTLAFGWASLVRFLAPSRLSVESLALAFLPLVVVLTVAATAMPLSWKSWRWTLAGLAAAFSAGTVLAATGHAGHQGAALTVATLAGAALFARWRHVALLVVPSITSLALVVTMLLWLHAPRPALGPGVLALALALWSVGRLVHSSHGVALRLVGATAACASFAIGFATQLMQGGDGINWSSHLDSLTLLAIALWVAWESLDVRRSLLRYVAGLVGVTAVLWELQALGVRELQAFAIPLGLYFMGAALVAGRARERGPRGGWLPELLWVLAGISFCLPTAAKAMAHSSVGRSILLLAESFVLVVLGVGIKRKGLLAVASTFVIVAGLRMVFQNPVLILPAFVVASVLFIGIGFAVLLWQGLKRRA